MSRAVKIFNGLNASVNLDKVKDIQKLAEKEGQTVLYDRLQKGIEAANGRKDILFNPGPMAIEQVSSYDLPGLDEIPDYISAEEFTGLNKAVSPDEIYQYITDLVLNTIEKVGNLPWQTTWEKTGFSDGKQATNFESKKGYRGINFFLLNFEVKQDEDGQEYMEQINFENPYFLTFKQIEKFNGKLKKGSKGKRVVYFTKLYSHSEVQGDGTKLEFSTYNKKKFIAWIEKHKNKLKILTRSGWTVERLSNSYIPILKYYNVFSAEDITGIDWGILPKNENATKSVKEKIEIAEAIIKSMPNPPKVDFGGNQPAYYPKMDNILIPAIDKFQSPQEYYSTYFHELIHSTGHRKRLSRPGVTLGKLTSKLDYAKEELIAEMGAVFLCAESGILFHIIDNSAKYLKGWNSRLVKSMKEDNRFYFRAASASQGAVDYILDRDKNSVPKYLKKQNENKKRPQLPEPKNLNDAIAYAKKNANWELTINPNSEVLKEVTSITKKTSIKKLEHLIYELKVEKLYSIASDLDWIITFKKSLKTIEKPKKKLSKKELEAANPKPKAVKPKSVSVATAVKDVIGLDKYNHKEVSPLTANLVYNLFKNAKLDQEEIFAENPSDYALGVLKKDGPFHHNWHGEEIELSDLGRDFVKAVQNRLDSLRNQKHNYAFFDGLNGSRSKISTDKFKKMTVPELRAFTHHYYNRNLKGKDNVFIKNRLQQVDFIGDGSRKILKPMYSAKAAVIEHLEELINNSTYNNFGERKKNEPPNVIGYLNFKSKVLIDGEKRHVRISLRLDRDRTTKFKGYEVGAKEKQAKSARAAVANPKDGQKKPVSRSKNTKTKPDSKKGGLKSPKTESIEPKTTAGGQSIGGSIRPLISGKHPKVRSIKHQAEKNPMFTIGGETSRFLQAVEKKPVDSVVVTLDGPQGAGKTTALYKFQNDFAEAGNRCLFASLEEHPSSNLATDKKDAYLTLAAQENIDTVGSFDNYTEFKEIVEHYDCIFIDSWQKLVRMIGAIKLDEDVRKKFNGKVFFVIFQQTTEGRTKGGAEIVFDGDIIIKMEKCASFKDNYAYFNKNRYTTVPIETIKYMIADGITIIENETQTVTPPPKEELTTAAENEEIFNFKVY